MEGVGLYYFSRVSRNVRERGVEGMFLVVCFVGFFICIE